MPPVGSANRVDDLVLTTGIDGNFLSWSYKNLGDYNQDGVVWVDDLTPLAANFGRTYDPGDVNSLLAVIDGNGNGTIDLADVTPIAQNYMAECKGYSVRGSSQYPNSLSETAEEFQVPFESASGEGRLRFRALYPTIGYSFIAVAAYDSGQAISLLSNVVEYVQANIPPQAILTANPTSGNAPLMVEFDASGSSDADGEIVRYWWDANGDGEFESITTGSLLSFTYLDAGVYNATVAVEDDEGAISIDIVDIAVNVVGNEMPVADLQATPLAGKAPLAVSFSATGSYDPDGQIMRFDYDFDSDGIWEAYDAAGEVIWTYLNAGEYTAKLRVTDGANAQAQDTVTISVNLAGNDLPIAQLAATPMEGNAPLEVSFDATGSYDPDGFIVRYDFDFDGNGIWDAYDAESIASWTYLHPGDFTAKLRVTDNNGAQASALVQIAVISAFNELPIADLQASPTTGNAPLAVSFDASGSHDADGQIIRYDYDFNDDGIWDAYDSLVAVEWTYASPGIHQAKLRVTDNAGAQAFEIETITVNAIDKEPPVADLQASPVAGNAPLNVNFNATGSYDPDGFIVRYDFDFDGDGIWDAYDSSSITAWTYLSPGNYEAKVRVTDDDGAQSTDVSDIAVNMSGNELPVADLQASPTSGESPLLVSFDATRSYDPDGAIIRYDYDFDGDGIWDAYDGPRTLSWTYLHAGAFTAKLRVTDDAGAQMMDTITITVYSWHVIAADNSPNQVGEYCCLAVVNGRPAIAYYDNTVDDLKYMRALDPAGVFWGTPITVDSSGLTGLHISLAVINGNPAISYYYDTSDDLRYVRAANADGTAWGVPVTVHSTGNVGLYTSLKIVNGNPAISYRNVTNTDLQYVRANDANGSTWGSPAVVISAGDVGYYTSLAVVDGFPAISCFNETSDDLIFVRAADANGIAWSSLHHCRCHGEHREIHIYGCRKRVSRNQLF